MVKTYGTDTHLEVFGEGPEDEGVLAMMGTSNPLKGKDDGEAFVEKPTKKLGTLQGVFFPCLANIFGVILFLRQPWICGQAGLIWSQVVVCSSVLTTTLTTLSISALSTNGQVKAGGTYFMISRTLGPEFGGAVGVSFYLATTIAIPMYLLGTVETIREGIGQEDLGMNGLEPQVLGVLFSLACMFVVFVGVQYVSKAIPFFLTATLIGIASMWLGLLTGWEADEGDAAEFCRLNKSCITSMWTDNQLGDNLHANFEDSYDWQYMFGLFFPSVTGITAGANLSAALKNPSRSIPNGTLSAIGVTSVIYVVNLVLFAMSVGPGKLKSLHTVVASDVAFPHPIVVQIAILSSTIGAALACFAGAPRLLQAIVYDGTLPVLNFLREDPEKEPRKTLLCTWVIAASCCLVGDLNFVTPICTIFYLTFYTFTNAACLLLMVLRSPNFRPDFKHANAWTAGGGLILCVTMMILINPFAALGAGVASACVYMYITTCGELHDWGDALFDLRWYTTRKSLLRLDKYGPVHSKNWRPNLMLLTKVSLKNGKPTLEEPDLVMFLSHLRHARGLQVLGTVVEHDMSVLPEYDIVEAREAITNLCHSKKMKCFVEVMMGDLDTGISALLQVAGMGRFQPNIIVQGWHAMWESSPATRKTFMSTLRMCEVLHKSLIILCSEGNYPKNLDSEESTIDIWWNPHGGGLLLLIPHLLSHHRDWSKTVVRCFSLVDAGSDEAVVADSVRALFAKLRFKCECFTIPFNDYVETYSYPRWSVKDVLAVASEQMNTPGNQQQLETASSLAKQQLKSSGSVKAAKKLNELIRQHSANASVVIMNLPKFKLSKFLEFPDDATTREYMASIGTLTEHLPPTLLIRDGGRDVTTSF
eukprot:TRINITY_DN5034_c1_g1_i1.p1 TRINITY_DN5034_c1_g1~~TRINITY_DN5034_c1_g1_i1.p1  ORF type:complete len:872 (+),score=218.69 TRINITY_DN5034_c1_g1_i1:59-2674(+)